MAKPTKSEPTNAKGGQRPGWVIPAAVVAVVVALFVVAAVATGLGGDDDEAKSTGGAAALVEIRPVSVTGTSLPDLKDGSDPAVGMPAPNVKGASFDGRPVEIGGTGRPALVFFVAHWCPHCRREVPLLALS